MAFTQKTDNKIMELIGVHEIRHLIADTSKGMLTLMLRKGETQYYLVLDAVPLDKETNKELMEILFPVKEVEIPQVNKDMIIPGQIISIKNPDGKVETLEVKPILNSLNVKIDKKGKVVVAKPKGRPKGSKNR